MSEKILITAALPYINNVPHMGHVVGSHLPADIFFKFCLQNGKDAIFIGGSDEHGTPSVVAAKENNISVEDFVNKLHLIHKKIYEKLGISYNIYSRTSSPNHHALVKEFFNEIYEKGYISIKKNLMYYSEEDKMFLPDRFIEGTCPKCSYENANGDQCENCGYVLLSSLELINPKSKISGSKPTLKETEHLYFELNKLKDELEEWINSKKDLWNHHVYSEAKKWLEDLKARSITRDMDWGIKVPLKGFKNKVFYVWFDAPIGYITFTKEIGKIDYFLNDNAKIYHFLGKDNIPFHTIFWPAMLLANEKYSMPYKIVGYNYLTYEGKKFSKSKKVGVFCYNLLNSDMDIDSLRFYLCSIIPESKDSDFKWESFKNSVNSELIGNISNFFNRTLNIAWKHFEGKIEVKDLNYSERDLELLNELENYTKIIKGHYEKVEIRSAQKKILELCSLGNKYIEINEPWNLVKNNKVEELKKVLHISINFSKYLAILLAPIIPNKMLILWKEQLNLKGTPLDFNIYQNLKIEYNHEVKNPYPLYNRIKDEDLQLLKDHFAKPFDFKDL